MNSILGTGLSGLVGSKFVDTFRHEFEFVNMDLSKGVDITIPTQVDEFVSNSSSPVILHFAAFTDVNKAYEETGNKDGIAYRVNVLGTKNMAEAAKKYGKHLIHISTAFVFDGQKPTPYVETDAVHPIEWYGQTKEWAEEEVVKSGCDYTILRIDRPYRQDDFPKPDILHKVMLKLKDGTLPPQFADTSWTSTPIEEFCQWLRQIIEIKPIGIYHATGEKIFSDYDFALWVKETYNLEGEVRKGSLEEYLKTNSRPYQKNTAMDSSKLRNLLSSAA